MDTKDSISSFAEKLKNAMSGDFSGWKLVYELKNGLKRFCTKDDRDRTYDAYVCGRCVCLMDPELQVVS